jgi:hypothetical protein
MTNGGWEGHGLKIAWHEGRCSSSMTNGEWEDMSSGRRRSLGKLRTQNKKRIID